MSTNADALVRQGINAYREGNKGEARSLLLQAVELDEESEQAWLWLSAVVDTVEDQQTCLENVLTINPNNEKARQGLEILQERAGDSPAVTTPISSISGSSPTAEDDPFAQVSFTPTSDADPFSVDDGDFDMEEDEDELPDTQWGIIQTSSASAQQPSAAQPSREDYDDWVAGLNLGSGESSEVFGDMPASDSRPPATSPFFDSASMFDDDDDPFEVDDSAFDIGAQTAGMDVDEEDEEEGFSASPFMTDFDLDDDEEEEIPARPAPVSPPSIMSPSAASPASQARGELSFENLDDDVFEDDMFDEFDDRDFDSVDPSELFRFIPTEIKATRLPGTRERYPVLVIVGLLLLLVLNGGALALVYLTLTTA